VLYITTLFPMFRYSIVIDEILIGLFELLDTNVYLTLA
jgi:hypothetical protein